MIEFDVSDTFEIAAILALTAMAWLALGRSRRGVALWVVLVVGVLLIARSLTS